jgi:NADPH-dependent curcumin reductase CurA
MSNTILLNSRPKGTPTLANFKFTDTSVSPLKEGEVQLETQYVSVDPYLRGRMSEAKSYIAPFELDKPISSGIIAKVTDSRYDKLKIGDYISGILPWKKSRLPRVRAC